MKDKKFNTINELLSFVGKSPRGTLYNGLYEEAMPKRGTFSGVQAYETHEGDVNVLKWELAFYFLNPELEFVVSSQNNTCSVSGQVFLMQLTNKIVLTSPHALIMLILKHKS